MALHVKKGDTVEVICGDHKGSTGKIIRVMPKENRVVVEGINLVHKHVKPSQQNPQGGRIRIEQPINISNVLPVAPKTSKGTRVKFVSDDKGSKKRAGVDGSEIAVVRKPGK